MRKELLVDGKCNSKVQVELLFVVVEMENQFLGMWYVVTWLFASCYVLS
jgi:hypothetical protein